MESGKRGVHPTLPAPTRGSNTSFQRRGQMEREGWIRAEHGGTLGCGALLSLPRIPSWSYV